MSPSRLLISRTDAIGDVMLTLPLATILKQQFPGITIGFIGRAYTKAVIACCSAVDEFIEMDDFLVAESDSLKQWDTIIHVFPRPEIAWKAKKAGIRNRIGTSSRLYHWTTCNKLVKLSRKNSELHEAQLNVKLLAPLGIIRDYSTEQLGLLYSFDRISPLKPELGKLLDHQKRKVILHPKSQGSAREWGLDHFAALARLLPKEQYQVFISGTEKEGQMLKPLFAELGNAVVDITGKMSLSEFISFINACDGLVAASTGPLHIAAALGKTAIGLYPPIRPMHAGRWGPLGPKALALSLDKDCSDCRKAPESCHCLHSISALAVAERLISA